jgi:hypothetical protein
MSNIDQRRFCVLFNDQEEIFSFYHDDHHSDIKIISKFKHEEQSHFIFNSSSNIYSFILQ